MIIFAKICISIHYTDFILQNVQPALISFGVPFLVPSDPFGPYWTLLESHENPIRTLSNGVFLVNCTTNGSIVLF